jgi:hypothetical protein
MKTPDPNIVVEEIKIKGNQLIDKVRSIAADGNAKRVIIRTSERTLLEFPLSVGVGGTAAALLIAPQLAAIGAIAALLTEVEVVVEREKPSVSDVVATPVSTTPPTTPLDADGKTMGSL